MTQPTGIQLPSGEYVWIDLNVCRYPFRINTTLITFFNCYINESGKNVSREYFVELILFEVKLRLLAPTEGILKSLPTDRFRDRMLEDGSLHASASLSPCRVDISRSFTYFMDIFKSFYLKTVQITMMCLSKCQIARTNTSISNLLNEYINKHF